MCEKQQKKNGLRNHALLVWTVGGTVPLAAYSVVLSMIHFKRYILQPHGKERTASGAKERAK